MEQLRAQLNGTECTVYVGAGLLRRAGGLLRDALPAVRPAAGGGGKNAGGVAAPVPRHPAGRL